MKHSNHRISIICCILIISILLTGGCRTFTRSSGNTVRSGFYFDTLVTVTIYDPSAADIAEKCLEECAYYDKLFSPSDPQGDFGRINSSKGEWVNVSKDTVDLLEYAVECFNESNGMLDISIAHASALWTGARNEKSLPDEADIKAAVSLKGLNGLITDREGLRVRKTDPALMLDAGSLGKGYIADRLKEFLEDNGVRSAVISCGGNINTLGCRPDGSPFKIGVKKPFDASSGIAVSLNISGKSVVTSGIYERYFTYEGNIYHHILDPMTGYPAGTDLSSATVICSSSLAADALSTECILYGLNDALKLINGTKDTEAVFITRDGDIFFSDGAEKYM
ncbi:MAG: FAD:protein FMN transferase [Lachnospiraceae bacterium]|nr:FAD:protein FMN transferase [Lachnospiraceae bacterium]